MRDRRGWTVSAVLLLLGAASGAGAVRQHWLACRGSMLSGSALHGYAYGSDFSDACLQAMDNGFAFVWPDGKDAWRPESVYGLTFALLVGTAWLVVVATNTWSRPTRLVAVLPAVLTIAAALVGILPRSDALDALFARLLLAISGSVLLALVVVVLRDTSSPRDMAKVALGLCGPGAIGFLASALDYAFMLTFSEADWDTPPGSGTPTVVVTALAGIVLLVLVAREPRAATTRAVRVSV